MKKQSVEMNRGESVIEERESKRQLRQLTECTCLIVKLSGEVIKKVAAIDLVMRGGRGKKRRKREKRVKDSLEYHSEHTKGHYNV